ncbi:hypothetical protein EE612_007452 [Oryza sativa]|nr:hypothetical protein EE612_007452 [Oryza sativa]
MATTTTRHGGRAADCSEAALQPPASARRDRRPAAVLRSPRQPAPLSPTSALFPDVDEPPSSRRRAGRRRSGRRPAAAQQGTAVPTPPPRAAQPGTAMPTPPPPPAAPAARCPARHGCADAASALRRPHRAAPRRRRHQAAAPPSCASRRPANEEQERIKLV